MEWIIYSYSDLNFYTKLRYYLEQRKTQNFTAAIVLSIVQCPVKDWNHILESIESYSVCWGWRNVPVIESLVHAVTLGLILDICRQNSSQFSDEFTEENNEDCY